MTQISPLQHYQIIIEKIEAIDSVTARQVQMAGLYQYLGKLAPELVYFTTAGIVITDLEKFLRTVNTETDEFAEVLDKVEEATPNILANLFFSRIGMAPQSIIHSNEINPEDNPLDDATFEKFGRGNLAVLQEIAVPAMAYVMAGGQQHRSQSLIAVEQVLDTMPTMTDPNIPVDREAVYQAFADIQTDKLDAAKQMLFIDQKMQQAILYGDFLSQLKNKFAQLFDLMPETLYITPDGNHLSPQEQQQYHLTENMITANFEADINELENRMVAGFSMILKVNNLSQSCRAYMQSITQTQIQRAQQDNAPLWQYVTEILNEIE